MYNIIITSSDNYDKLREIASYLMVDNLSPCTHIIKDVESFYLWDSQLNNNTESLLLIKCKNENIDKVKNIVLKFHNYKVPELICHEFNIISSKYRKWFNHSN